MNAEQKSRLNHHTHAEKRAYDRLIESEVALAVLSSMPNAPQHELEEIRQTIKEEKRNLREAIISLHSLYRMNPPTGRKRTQYLLYGKNNKYPVNGKH